MVSSKNTSIKAFLTTPGHSALNLPKSGIQTLRHRLGKPSRLRIILPWTSGLPSWTKVQKIAPPGLHLMQPFKEVVLQKEVQVEIQVALDLSKLKGMVQTAWPFKIPLSFHYTGWFIWIPLLDYHNPQSPIYWVV